MRPGQQPQERALSPLLPSIVATQRNKEMTATGGKGGHRLPGGKRTFAWAAFFEIDLANGMPGTPACEMSVAMVNVLLP